MFKGMLQIQSMLNSMLSNTIENYLNLLLCLQKKSICQGIMHEEKYKYY